MVVDLGQAKAIANPTKAFFVRMITRDITLEDCILDLIDNSVDGAWRLEGSRPMGLDDETNLSAYRIDITATPNSFVIVDNCGGMSLEDAVDHAFSFGRKPSEITDHYSIGVYGIGMKRAVFKLGSTIKVRSTIPDGEGGRFAFAVPIAVDAWLADDTPPWDFDIVEDEPLAANGVEISVSDLTAGAVNAFGNPAFLQNLKRTIARDYSIHLHRGLMIVLNGAQIQGAEIELLQSDDFAPVHIEYEDEVEEGKVSIEIIGGMAARPPDTADPDVEDEGEKRFGWYVVCNGRIVLAADKTSVAGWGTEDWPQWHRQYSGFIGLILFTAESAAALPLTTTKRSVDVSSEVYRRARPKMRDVTRAWIDYTNSRKQALEEARMREAAASAVTIYAVPKQAAVKLPGLTARQTERMANVNYSVPLTRMKALARAFGSGGMAYRDVGLKSFDYAYSDLAGDE